MVLVRFWFYELISVSVGYISPCLLVTRGVAHNEWEHMTPLKQRASYFNFTVNVDLQLRNLYFWTRHDFRILKRPVTIFLTTVNCSCTTVNYNCKNLNYCSLQITIVRTLEPTLYSKSVRSWVRELSDCSFTTHDKDEHFALEIPQIPKSPRMVR